LHPPAIMSIRRECTCRLAMPIIAVWGLAGCGESVSTAPERDATADVDADVATMDGPADVDADLAAGEASLSEAEAGQAPSRPCPDSEGGGVAPANL
jgi:hypothetical protein